MNENTIWNDVVGFEGLYKVSEYGLVKSMPRIAKHSRPGLTRSVPEKIISQWKNHGGYWLVSLHKKGKKYGIAVHIIVAKAFIPNPENKPEVNHKFGNKDDNYYKHLEWMTRLENQQHGVYELGKHHAGEAHYNAKLTVEVVLEMRELYATGKYNMAEIGRMFGITTKDHAANVIKGKCWKTLIKSKV